MHFPLRDFPNKRKFSMQACPSSSHPALPAAVPSTRMVRWHGSGISLLVVGLMLAFPGSSYAGGAAGVKSIIAPVGTGGGIGAGYDGAGNFTTNGAGNVNGTALGGLAGGGAGTTNAAGGSGGGIGSTQNSPGGLTSAVTGGAGGGGTSGGAGGGGDGVVLGSGGTVNVTVTGGAGGVNVAGLAGAGGGGAGIVYTATNAPLAIGSAVTGGVGGRASQGGGGGGSGVWVTSNGAVDVTTTGTVAGGNGGSVVLATGSDGGGGAGVVFNGTGGQLQVDGQVRGGTTGGSGTGGAGVNIVAGGVTVTVDNGALIAGGAGGNTSATPALGSSGGAGSGGAAGGNTSIPHGGVGGIGIVAAGGHNTIVTSGAINGATGLAGQANAITFSGGNNILELRQGFSFIGDVVAGGNNDLLRLGGDTGSTGSFDVSRIGAALGSNTTAYQGFTNFEKVGASTWTLTGTTTQVTPWTLSGGTLSVSSDGALGASSGVLTLNGGTLQNTATFTTARNITLTANGGTLETAGADLTVSGVVSGQGELTKQGNGTLNLTGDSSGFTGASDVAAGTLAVDGKLGGTLAVDSGATLTGIGTVGTTTLASGSILAPGNSATPVGTLTVNGNLTFAPGSTYQVQTTPGATTSSLVNVSGTANLAGSVVHIGENGNYAGSTTYTILTADQLNGTFGSVSSNLAFLTPSLFYDAHDVMLRLQMKENFADAAVTRNQRAVANALQSLPVNNNLYNRILNLPNGAPPSVFNALSGEVHASTTSILQGITDNVIRLPMAHLRANLDADELADPATAQPVWVQGFGNRRSLGGNGDTAKVEESDGGLFVGADRAVGNGWRLGGALGYTGSHSTIDDRSSKADIDSYSATAYGGKAFEAGPGKIKLTAGAAYTWSDIRSQRDVNAAGLDQTLKSKSGASTGQVFTELGYALPLNDRATIEPFAGAAYSDLRMRGFSESGGSAALDGEANSNDVTTTTLGLHAQTAFAAQQIQGHLHGTMGWRHAFGDVTPETTMTFGSSQAFTEAGAPIAHNAAVLEMGADVPVSKNTTVGIAYDGQFGEGNQQNAGSINVNWRI
jgi:outer membrane autotransporter protein